MTFVMDYFSVMIYIKTEQIEAAFFPASHDLAAVAS
jgi:hypothetical protein